MVPITLQKATTYYQITETYSTVNTGILALFFFFFYTYILREKMSQDSHGTVNIGPLNVV